MRLGDRETGSMSLAAQSKRENSFYNSYTRQIVNMNNLYLIQTVNTSPNEYCIMTTQCDIFEVMKAAADQVEIVIRHLEAIIVNLKAEKSKAAQLKLAALIEIQALQAVIDELKERL